MKLNKMLKRKNSGFTLAELLIVVAIIAVLTAIAIPVFMNSVDDAEKSVDAANKRAIRAELTADLLTMDTPAGSTGYCHITSDGEMVYKGEKDAATEYKYIYKYTVTITDGADPEITVESTT